MKRRTWIKPELARAYRRIDRGWPGMTALLLHAVATIHFWNMLLMRSYRVVAETLDNGQLSVTTYSVMPPLAHIIVALVLYLTLLLRAVFWARIALRSLQQRPWLDDAILILWQAVDRGLIGWVLLVVHGALFFLYMSAIGPSTGVEYISGGQITIPRGARVPPSYTLLLNPAWAAVIGFTLIVRALWLGDLALHWFRRVWHVLVSLLIVPLVIAAVAAPWLAWVIAPLLIAILLRIMIFRHKRETSSEDAPGRKRKPAERPGRSSVSAYAIDHDGELIHLHDDELALLEAHRAAREWTGFSDEGSQGWKRQE